MIKRIIISIVFILLCTLILKAQTSDYSGKYSYNNNWQGKSGKGQVIINGTIIFRVYITAKLEIEGTIDFQPPSKILKFKSNLKYIKDKEYEFIFIDNFQNESKGKIDFNEKGLDIDLEIIKRSVNGSKIGNLYGNYSLLKEK
jgi:hypothetical protein